MGRLDASACYARAGGSREGTRLTWACLLHRGQEGVLRWDREGYERQDQTDDQKGLWPARPGSGRNRRLPVSAHQHHGVTGSGLDESVAVCGGFRGTRRATRRSARGFGELRREESNGRASNIVRRERETAAVRTDGCEDPPKCLQTSARSYELAVGGTVHARQKRSVQAFAARQRAQVSGRSSSGRRSGSTRRTPCSLGSA